MLDVVPQSVWFGAAATGFAGYAATNLDNIAVLCAVVAGTTDAARRASVALVCAAVALGLLALAGAEIADEISVSNLRWLGIVPLCLGAFSLFRLLTAGTADTKIANAAAGPIALILIVLSNSADTLAVFVPLLAESTGPFRGAFLGGASLAVLVMAALLRSILSNQKLQTWLGRLGSWFAPLAMILAGLYVILDTPTDLI